jgi:hypothetical protein
MGLDDFMPRFDVFMRHEALVHAPLAQAYEALRAVDLTESWLAAALFWLRGLGRTRRAAPADFLEGVQHNGFVLLADRPDKEVVFGIVGKFWLPSGGRVCDLTREGFLAFHRDGFAKATWSISFASQGPGLTLVATETRVHCLGNSARRRLRLYWTFVRPFSGLIRHVLLRQVKQRAERAAA